MNIEELKELIKTSFELKPGPLYLIGLNDNKPLEIFSKNVKCLQEYFKKEGIRAIFIPASDIDKIYKLEKSDDK